VSGNKLLMQYYTLTDDHMVRPCSQEEWAELWRGDQHRRIVAQTEIGGLNVSTVFLGIDHDFTGVGPALLFETMVFGDGDGDLCERYSTWDQAVAGHERLVKELS
jgi:hypothetical protein